MTNEGKGEIDMKTIRDLKSILGVAAMLSLVAAAGAGCNTVEGLGKDTEAAGESIQDTSRDVKEEITD
jgi:predicted small secreted protein